MLERLNKILAAAGIASRRQIDAWIAAGRFKVNGQPAQLGQKINPESDIVTLNHKILNLAARADNFEYWLVNKPRGIISTAKDSHGRPAVTSLVKSRARLYPVGRLDADSEGLILLTNDGDLAYRLTHPKFEVPKTYEVLLAQAVGPATLEQLANGVRLDDGLTAPAEVRHLGDKWLEIILKEGRKRQIRRMCAALRLGVVRLKRVSLASLKLGRLETGQARPLTAGEIKELKKF